MKPRILLATLALASALRPRHVAPLRCAQKALGAACAALALAGPAHAVDASGQVQKGAAKIAGGGASTLQSGRVIAITRGVNLDDTDWTGKDLKGVAFQQSVLRNCNFRGVNLFSADLSNADLRGADLTQAYMAGAVIKDLKLIDDTDWTDVDMRKDQRSALCAIAAGKNPRTGVDTRESLMCP